MDGAQHTQQNTGIDEAWAPVARDLATEAEAYLTTLRQLATDADAATALPLLLLAVGQLGSAGARLGALEDVVPVERFEPDSGPDPDLDRIRESLRELLTGVDTYCDLADPVISVEVVEGSLSDDLVSVADDLLHGLRHHRAGQSTEALWWWQFSYLSSWGERVAAISRVLVSLLSHVRLDADAEQVMEAQMEALHRP